MHSISPTTPTDQRYRLSFENAAVGLAHCALDGRWISVNAAYCEILGYSEEELLALTFRDVTHPEDLAADNELAGRLLNGEIDTYTMEKRYVRKDGSTVWVELKASIVRNDDGTPDFFVASAIDVSKRKAAEAALIRTNDRYRQSTSAAQVGTWDWNLDTNLFSWSASSAAIFGVAHVEGPIDPEVAFRTVHPDDQERLRRTIEQGVINGDYECEFRGLRPDGSVRWVMGRGKATYNEQGRAVHFYGINIDITDLKRTEEALRLRDQEFSTLANTISQLAWMAEPDGRHFWYNQRWLDYTGKSLEQMESHGWTELLHPDHRDRVIAGLERSWRTGEAWEDVFPLRGKADDWRWFLSRALPIHDGQGNVVRWFGTHTDITEQFESQRKLAEAVKIRDEFISVASHELRTPLTSMSLQIGAMAHVPQETLKRYVEVSQRQVARLARLVEEMLDVSRLTNGTLNLQPMPTELRGLVEEAVQQLWPQITSSNRQVRVFCDEPVVGQWDAARLDQVVVNLVNNALKYAPGSAIDITLGSDGKRATLSVRDYGKGIPPEMQQRIFERFERGGRTDKSGLGLGLFIANEIVRLHGGTLRVESEPGQGANFVVELPLQRS